MSDARGDARELAGAAMWACWCRRSTLAEDHDVPSTTSSAVAIAEVVTPVEIPRVGRVPDDDQVLAIAITGSANALVTGGADILALGAYAGVNMRSVSDFEARG